MLNNGRKNESAETLQPDPYSLQQIYITTTHVFTPTPFTYILSVGNFGLNFFHFQCLLQSVLTLKLVDSIPKESRWTGPGSKDSCLKESR